MVGRSPPHHRHDGTSPLPMGMDYSPAPVRWTGPHSIWPHDPRTGWSYCVMIPSWTVLQDANAAESHLASPIVFYRVQVGIQSPQGMSIMRKVLRRFSDFLKLHSAVKRAFPKKQLPVAPPKNSLLWMNAKNSQLEERRLAVLDWLAKLLSDIDISRSAPVAAFLELEAAARAAMESTKGAQVSAIASSEPCIKSGLLSAGGSPSVMSETESHNDAGNDMPEESSNVGAKVDAFFGHQADALTGIKHEIEESNLGLEVDRIWHARRPSLDSIESEMSSAKASDFLTATGDEHSDVLSVDNMHDSGTDLLPTLSGGILKDVHASLPSDHRGKVKRLLASLQRQLNIVKTDMEDLIIRLNQETAVKEFLATKVRDLEGEVDTTRRKSKEMLQRAVSMEQENMNNLQWELEEARASLLNADERILVLMEARAQAENKLRVAEAEKANADRDVIELKEKIESLKNEKESSDAKAKAEMKVLIREVKALRNSQPEAKERMETLLKEKMILESVIENDRRREEQQKMSQAKFLHEVQTLRKRLQECSLESLARQEDKCIMKSSDVRDMMDLLMTSENRIGMLAAEAQLLMEEKEDDKVLFNPTQNIGLFSNGSPSGSSLASQHGSSEQYVGSENALRKMLSEVFLDNIQLYKVINSMTLNATVMDANHKKGGPDSLVKKNSNVLNRFL